MSKTTKKMVEANKIAVAKKQVADMEGVADVLPAEIREDEKNYVRVAVIRSRPNPATLKYEHKVKLVKYHPESFAVGVERNKYQQLGYGIFVVIHSPINLEADGSKTEEVAEPRANVAKTVKLVDACETIQALDRLVKAEAEHEDGARQGVLKAVAKKREELENTDA